MLLNYGAQQDKVLHVYCILACMDEVFMQVGDLGASETVKRVL